MSNNRGPGKDSETRRILEARIDAFPDNYRAVFVLRALEALPVEETAAALDITEAAVRMRYLRARSLLHESRARDIDRSLEQVFAFDGARCTRIVSNVLNSLKPET